MMQWPIIAFAWAAVLGAAAAAGQQTAEPPGKAPTTEHVTMIGCVERADQVQAQLGFAPVGSQSFVLIKAEQRHGGGDDVDFIHTPEKAIPTGTAGETRKAEGTELGRVIRLDGDADTLNDLVGQQIEVTGQVSGAVSNAPANTAPAVAAGVDGAPSVLRVESVTAVAPNCPR